MDLACGLLDLAFDLPAGIAADGTGYVVALPLICFTLPAATSSRPMIYLHGVHASALTWLSRLDLIAPNKVTGRVGRGLNLFSTPDLAASLRQWIGTQQVGAAIRIHHERREQTASNRFATAAEDYHEQAQQS